MKTLSIAMATYNGEAFIAEQFQSILSQTRLPDELVVTDDRSSDGTEALVRAFAETAPFPVTFEINTERLGYGRNFARAMSLTTGDIIFFSDQDDVWLPEKLERIEAAFRKAPDRLCVMCDAIITNEALDPIGATKQQQIRKAGLGEAAFVMGCCAAIDAEFAHQTLPLPEHVHAHDSWTISLAYLLERKLSLDEPLQFYRRHDAAVSQIPVNDARNRSAFSMTLRNVLRRFRSLRSNEAILAEYHMAVAQKAWLSKHQTFAEVGTVDLDALLGALERRIEVLAQRIAVRQLPRAARLFKPVEPTKGRSLPLRSRIKDLAAARIGKT